MAFSRTEGIWKQRDCGDISIYYRWVNDEPCMTLYPRYADFQVNKPTGVDLPLSTAYTLADSVTGAPTPGLLGRLERAALAMGMSSDKFTCRRIADVIVDGLPDLIEMPPFPPRSTMDDKKLDEVVGEGLIKVGGRTIWEGEATAGDMT